jgi:hypothetical protein
MVGYRDFGYRTASGTENDWFKIGFSTRKQALTLYLMSGSTRTRVSRGSATTAPARRAQIKDLAKVDLAVREELMPRSLAFIEDA